MTQMIVWVQEVVVNDNLERIAVFSSYEAADKWFDAYIQTLEPPVFGRFEVEGHCYEEVIDNPQIRDLEYGSA
jgi:hypothetical protein